MGFLQMNLVTTGRADCLWKGGVARLALPQLYYVHSGNDFRLDINNPKAPQILCVSNNPQKIQNYGAVLSLYVNRLVKLVNKKGKLNSSLVFDGFPTIYLNIIDSLTPRRGVIK